jgi:pilus assembly protein Flp/PilA
MPDSLRSTLRDDAGATAIEYSLIAGLIAVGIIAALTVLGTGVQGILNSIVSAF